VIFPWYLARRRTPQAPVPFLEGGPVIRLVILALLLFFLANLIYYFVQGPLPGTNHAQPVNEQKSSGSRVTLYPMRPWKGMVGTQCIGGTLHLRVANRSGQAETSAPSDAWHT
jgi:hypothetical protein